MPVVTCVPPSAAEPIGSSLTGNMIGVTHFVWVPSRDRTREADFGLREQTFQFGPLSFESCVNGSPTSTLLYGTGSTSSGTTCIIDTGSTIILCGSTLRCVVYTVLESTSTGYRYPANYSTELQCRSGSRPCWRSGILYINASILVVLVVLLESTSTSTCAVDA
eukprot:COSAG02_NODE_940_length_15773_cov_5.301263_6_plen_164_part_00